MGDDKPISKYAQGFLDALQMFSSELNAYADFSFDSGGLTNEQVDAIYKMERDLQEFLVEKIDELGETELTPESEQ